MNNKTFRKAVCPYSCIRAFSIFRSEKGNERTDDNSLQSRSMRNSYISNIKIQIHKITIERPSCFSILCGAFLANPLFLL